MPHALALVFRADRPAPPELLQRIRRPHRALFVDAELRSMRDQALLRFRLRQAHIDLYHAPYYGMAIFPGVPYVVAVHDIIPARFPQYWPRHEALIIRTWQKRVVRGAACIITGSHAAVDDLISLYGVAAAKIVVSPWGVVEWTVEAKPLEAPPIERPYLLCVCTNKPHKNLVRLIQAYQDAAGSQDTFPALVVAGGWSDRYPEVATAMDVANTSRTSALVRHIPNPGDAQLRYLYEHGLGFVFPSLYEGFGLPVLEAMQAGLPVAASTTPAVAEVCGDAALAFDPLDVASMSAAIRRCCGKASGRWLPPWSRKRGWS